jgi:hypothetical protein
MATKKITKSLLDKVQSALQAKAKHEANLSQLGFNMGTIQVKLMEESIALEKSKTDLQAVQDKIQEKYGEITIDVGTGEIKENE